MNQSLQSLRGIFAIIIFLHHSSLNGQSAMQSGGDCGVAFFIILSGFVMSAGYSDRVLQPSFSLKKFIHKRLSKIYPLHLAGFLIWALLLSAADPTPAGPIITNLLLVQSWIPTRAYFFSCNSVSWYLSTLLFCYLAFPTLSRRISTASTHTLTIAATLTLAVYATLLILTPGNLLQHILYICPATRILDFTLGMLLWHLYRHTRTHHRISKITSHTKLTTLAQTIILTTLIATIALFSTIPTRLSLASYWWIPCGTLILALALTDTSASPITRLLKTRPMLWLGETSFALFIIHQPIIRLWTRIAHRYGFPNDTIPVILLLLITTLTLATAITLITNSKWTLQKPYSPQDS